MDLLPPNPESLKKKNPSAKAIYLCVKLSIGAAALSFLF